MKTVKRLVICLTCLVVLLSSLPYSASASSDDNVFYEYDENGEVIAEYYTYHEDYDLKKGYSDTLDSDRGPMMFAASRSLYSWKPDTINWASFPSYIRAIAYSPYSNISWLDDNGGDYPNRSSYRAPFIMITSNGTNYTIRAGWDVGIWYRSSTGNATVGFHKTNLDYLDPVLYMATFKCSDNSVVSNWTEKAYDTWGTTGQMYNFSGSGIGLSDNFDVFTYGANGFVNVRAVLYNAKLNDTDYVNASINNSGRGMLDSAGCGFPMNFYNNASSYITTFTPAAPNSYTVTASSTFGLNSTILTGDKFLFHEDLPYGKDTLVIAATINDGHTYQLLTDSNADVVYLRNWNWSQPEKLRVTLISSAPVYRLGYNANNGGNVSMNSASGLTLSDQSPGYSGSDIALDKIIQYYVDKGYHFYSYSYPAGNIALTVSNNSSKLKIDDSLTFPHSFAQYPNADTLNQSLLEEQNKTSKSIWQTLQDIFGNIISLPSDIANAIKGFFTELSDNISDYFTTLRNYLLYFQATKPEHVNPFANILTDIESFFDDQMSDVTDFKNSLNTTLDNVVGYISSGSGIINQFLTAVPLVSAFVTFFVVFCIVRKVVGR